MAQLSVYHIIINNTVECNYSRKTTEKRQMFVPRDTDSSKFYNIITSCLICNEILSSAAVAFPLEITQYKHDVLL